MTTAFDWLAYHGRNSPHKIALDDLQSGRRVSYGALDERAARLALAMRERWGVRRHDRVALLARNTAEFFEIMFACRRLGAIFLPLNWRLSAAELSFIVSDAGARVLVADEDFADKAGSVRRAAGIETAISLSGDSSSAYEDVLRRSGRIESPCADVVLDDVWCVMYTSGTTGRPKGAKLTYRMVLFNSINAALSTGLSANAVGLTFMPLFHVGGLFCFASFLLHYGGTTYLMRDFDPERALALLADSAIGITHLLGVPTNFTMMGETAGFAEARLNPSATMIVGGAAASGPLIEQYLRKGISLQQGWGMTEVASIGSVTPRHDVARKIGSCGIAMPHSEIMIVDSNGRPAGTGDVGELLVRGPTVSPGYWQRPDADAQAFIDGWFRTGDAARIDGDGHLYLVGRYKDMYISGGENVYAAEVEAVLCSLPGILEAAVVGIPDPKWGEVGKAVLVRRPGAAVTAEDVRRHCEGLLARFKLPKRIVFVGALPRNAIGKVQKPELINV